ncbi:MAG: STAS domain-containing protein [Tepidisphaerales bacterium]
MSSMPSEPVPVNSTMVTSARRVGDALVVAVKGDVDLNNSPELRAALLNLTKDAFPRRLVLDLASTSYMDSSAIAVLVEMLQKAKKAGAKVCLVRVQPRVRGLLEIARLDTLFTLAGTEEEAIRS